MAKLSAKHRNTLIAGLIALGLYGGTKAVEWFFTKEEKPKTNIQESTINSVQSKDSSTSILNQNKLSQNIDSGAKVTNEFVGGDKITNNVTPIEPKNKIAELPPFDNRGGNLSLNQKGGTVNQYTINPKPEPRHLTEGDIKQILDFIPSKDYPIDVTYVNKKEIRDFANEIINSLQTRGYTVTFTSLGIFNNSNSILQKFYLLRDYSNNKIEIDIFPQEE